MYGGKYRILYDCQRSLVIDVVALKSSRIIEWFKNAGAQEEKPLGNVCQPAVMISENLTGKTMMPLGFFPGQVEPRGICRAKGG
jgi:hypothetical protein